jgi:SNF2 family DNA or RNA helicase
MTAVLGLLLRLRLLCCHPHLVKGLSDELESPENEGLVEDIEESYSDSGSDEEDDSLRDFIVDDEIIYEIDTAEPSTNPQGKRFLVESSAESASLDKKMKLDSGKAKLLKPRLTLAQLKEKSGKSAKAKAKYLQRLQKMWISSSKIDRTMEILAALGDQNSRVDKSASGKVEKIIVFSQFTSLLDLLEVPISQRAWQYRRFDGSMSSKLRNEAISEFNNNDECFILLISLKAGNAGLNLTIASQVIIFDPFWNPFVEEQAIDRAYRIGQGRNVMIHRVLVKDTVEDRILALQAKKRELIEGALDENARAGVGKLSQNDLAYLFGISA